MNRNTFLKISGGILASLSSLNLLANKKNNNENNAEFRFEIAPYIISLTDTEGFIVFATNKPSVAEVELIFENGTKKKFFASHNTAGIKCSGTLHAIKLFGLKAGETIAYTISATEIKKFWARLDKIEGRFELGQKITVAGDNEKPLKFKVPSASEKTKVAFLTDIHHRVKLMRQILSQMGDSDMLILNGDMANWLDSRENIFSTFLSDASDFASGQKPIYYARGNHECRGKLAEEFSQYVPFPNGKTYCGFRKGPAYFLILDSCEMWADTHRSNGGFIDLENWQKDEALWLKEEIKKSDFIDAKFRIVFQHIPIYTDDKLMHNSTGSRMNNYNTFRKKLFYDDILKNAKIDLMVNGHTHKYLWAPVIKGLNFPVFICSNQEGAYFTIDNENINIKIYNYKGVISRPEINIKAKV